MLRGKNAIVTGARRGIGNATVTRFAQLGANVWACARVKDESFERQMEELSERYGVWIRPVYFDLGDENAIKEAMMALVKQPERIDILVNNAGVAHGALLQMTSMKAMRDVFQINYFAPMQVTQIVLRKMTRQKQGAIVNLSSVEGLIGNAGYTSYGASKAAVAFSTKSLAKELSPFGIRVNAVAPGLIETDMGGQMDDKAQQRMMELSAAHRKGQPGEVADVIAFLASDAASYINGQVLRIDGGM